MCECCGNCSSIIACPCASLVLYACIRNRYTFSYCNKITGPCAFLALYASFDSCSIFCTQLQIQFFPTLTQPVALAPCSCLSSTQEIDLGRHFHICLCPSFTQECVTVRSFHICSCPSFTQKLYTEQCFHIFARTPHSHRSLT